MDRDTLNSAKTLLKHSFGNYKLQYIEWNRINKHMREDFQTFCRMNVDHPSEANSGFFLEYIKESCIPYTIYFVCMHWESGNANGLCAIQWLMDNFQWNMMTHDVSLSLFNTNAEYFVIECLDFKREHHKNLFSKPKQKGPK